ncbi:GTP-binding protein [Candidatus Micrarchaeota archaeon]|jgi:hypothetical protein|nr:GTP-binding protein [Candidatus Micrarchaeota archaeon]
MSIIQDIKKRFQNLFKYFQSWFSKKNEITIGFFGCPNVGKTALANRMCVDAGVDPMGNVSVIPHETREVLRKEGIKVKINGSNLSMNILDLPGVAIKVDYREFLNYGLSVDEAQERAREATKGIVEALKIMEKIDAALIILDATDDPRKQVNITLLGAMEARDIPFIIVANKNDLENADVGKIKKVLPEYSVVEISALKGNNMEILYGEISKRLR